MQALCVNGLYFLDDFVHVKVAVNWVRHFTAWMDYTDYKGR